jgi:hypothetical protein
MKTWNDLSEHVDESRLEQRSCWCKGVFEIAVIIVENIASAEEYEGRELPATWAETEEILLNGAANWRRYVEGGGALIYNEEIAYALLTPSELKRWERNPSYVPGHVKKGMTMLDLQVRAAYQAAMHIRNVYSDLTNPVD